MADSDLTQTYIGHRPGKASQARSKQAVNSAMRHGGELDTSKKFGGGGNKQFSANKNTATLDRETEELHHRTVDHAVSQLIQQGRQAKGWTQKELATKMNEKPEIIKDYESGKAIPNQQVLSKMERMIGMKLRGKDKGKPMN